MDLPHPELSKSPYRLFPALGPRVPLVFASPHSGSDYPDDFLQSARLDPQRLRRSEDCFVDELFAAAPINGAPLLAATFPRAWCDPNREPWELDPAMFEEALPSWVNSLSPRVGAGLGTIARIVSSGEPIYRRKLRFAEAEERVHGFWHPYHAALDGLIADTHNQFGTCLLVDCHSMPGMGSAAGGIDFVLGDAHGIACMPAITALFETTLKSLGYQVRRNDPYAGGYTTRHYGRPRRGVHALQVEVARGLYMDELRILKSDGFARLAADLTQTIETVARDIPALLIDSTTSPAPRR